MEKKIAFLLLFLISHVLSLQLIFSADLTIKEITFYGCKHSKPENLQRKINLYVGDEFNENLPNAVKDKLLNLKIFKMVEVEQRIVGNQVFLIVSVSELPQFQFGAGVEFNASNPDCPAEEDERDSFGFRLGNTDYSGGQKSIQLIADVGSRDGLSLDLNKVTSWGAAYGAQIGISQYDSKMGQDDQIEKGWVKFHFKRQWDYFKLRWWGEYDRIWLDTETGVQRESYWRSGVKGDLDFRDNPLFPCQGVRLLLGVYRTWAAGKALYDALDWGLDIYGRGVKKNHALAFSFRGHLTEGQVPFLDKLSTGGYQTIRGLKSYMEMKNLGLWGTLEYRIPFGNFDPHKAMFMASSVYLFADAGLFADRIVDLKNSHLIYSAGLGFLWQIGKEGAIRFDWTLSPEMRFTIGTGWKF